MQEGVDIVTYRTVCVSGICCKKLKQKLEGVLIKLGKQRSDTQAKKRVVRGKRGKRAGGGMMGSCRPGGSDL